MSVLSPTYIPNHADLAEAALLYQFRTKANIPALARALASGAQAFEDELFGVIMGTEFSLATGVNLDRWGELVGAKRNGLTDSEYRPFIRGQILANRSSGKTDELIQVFQEITDGEVRHQNLFPAGFQMIVVRTVPMSDRVASRVGLLMRTIKPAGISMDLIEAVTGYFGFAENPDAFGYDLGLFSRAL